MGVLFPLGDKIVLRLCNFSWKKGISALFLRIIAMINFAKTYINFKKTRNE
jgi:hypothetical protein